MEFKEYYIENNEGKSNCVIRSLCKLYNKEYNDIYNELITISKELNSESYNDVEVFETFMKRYNTLPLDYGNNLKIKDLKLDNGSYIVFCYNKKDFYHMIPIINNIVYDKDNRCLNLYAITIYKKER